MNWFKSGAPKGPLAKESSLNWGAVFVSVLIVLAFALTGGMYLSGGGGSDEDAQTLATYDGGKITLSEARGTLSEIIQSQPELANQAASQDFLRVLLVRQALQRVWQQKLLLNLIDSDLSLKVFPDDILLKTLIADSAFKDEQGRFSKEKLSDYLVGVGMSEDALKKELEKAIKTQTLINTLALAQVNTPPLASAYYAALRQTRAASILRIQKSDLVAAESQTLKDSELEAYYEANRARFMTPQTRTFEYIRLSVDTQSEPSEADLKRYYEAYVSQHPVGTPKLRVIFIKKARSALLKDVELALKSQENSFAQVATRYSDGPEAPEGGAVELKTLPSSLQDAAQKLALGQITSTPVQTEAGFYYLAKDKAVEKPSLESMKKALTLEFRADQAKKKLQSLTASFEAERKSNKPLSEIAKDLHAPLLKTGTIQDGETPEFAKDRPEAFASVFLDDRVLKGQPSRLFPLNKEGTQYAALRIEQTQPPRQRALSEVKDEIRTQLANERVLSKMRQNGALQALIQGRKDEKSLQSSLEKLLNLPGKTRWVSVNTDRYGDKVSLPKDLIDRLFAQKEQASLGEMPDSEGQYDLIVIREVKNGDFSALNDEEKRAFLENGYLLRTQSALEAQLLLSPKLEKAPLRVNEKAVKELKLVGRGDGA